MSIIKIERRVLEKNDELAQKNRELLSRHSIYGLNMVSSPGSGKTSILERTLETLDGSLQIAVIEGDVQTDYDAQRVARYKVPVAQIVTHGGCHLEARLVGDALSEMELSGVELLIIEKCGKPRLSRKLRFGRRRKSRHSVDNRG